MAKRTQIVCLHEGRKGRSVDPLFIRALLKKLDPVWIRPWKGNNVIRPVDCGGRLNLISSLPEELKASKQAGGNTTIMVWADVDDDMENPDALKDAFWVYCQNSKVSREDFENVVFIFAKDRLENWVEFLNTGSTDESCEGPRVKDQQAIQAAKTLADLCLRGAPIPNVPSSLEWSCKNWHSLKSRMM